MTPTDNLEDIIKQWIWKHLVVQSNFVGHADIFPEKTEYTPNNKDSISFYFTNFQYKTLRPDIKVGEVVTKVQELRTCTLSISYCGVQAFRKLDAIAARIRSDDTQSDFLEQYAINSDILTLIDVSRLIGDNNVQEAAQLDVVLNFESVEEKNTPENGYIEGLSAGEFNLF